MPTENKPLAVELIRAVELLSATLSERSIRYAIIGGLATMMRGRPRFTQDVDVLLDVPQLALPLVLEDLSNRGFTLNVPAVVKQFVQEHLAVFRFGSVRIDWLKPVLPLYARTLADAAELPWTEGRHVRVATAEGLILTKLVAFREQDQADIVTLLSANRDTIDMELIRREWQPYAASESSRTAWLEATIARLISASSSNS
jgi:hypothetical protein